MKAGTIAHVTIRQLSSKSKSEKYIEVVDENKANGDDIEDNPILIQEEMHIYKSMTNYYQPKEFNRQEGCLGKTYFDPYGF